MATDLRDELERMADEAKAIWKSTGNDLACYLERDLRILSESALSARPAQAGNGCCENSGTYACTCNAFKRPAQAGEVALPEPYTHDKAFGFPYWGEKQLRAYGDARAAAAVAQAGVPEGFRIEVAYAGDRFVTTQYTLVSPDKRRWTPGPGEVGQQLLVALAAAPQPQAATCKQLLQVQPQAEGKDEAAEAVFVECRQCDVCWHVGINDGHLADAACLDCDWYGPSPSEDTCPKCGRDGTMTVACPKCSGRYALLAYTEIKAAAAAEALALIVEALETSAPLANGYPEPKERHASALRLARRLAGKGEG